MKSALYPGSFDPLTFGHIDIIERAAKIFDHLTVCVMVNYRKKYMFTLEERCNMLRECLSFLPNVTVDFTDKMLIEVAYEKKIEVIVKGLRNAKDYEYETEMFWTNKILSPKMETLFIMASQEYAYLSSSSIRELTAFRGDISKFVPPMIEKAIRIKYWKD